MLVKAPFVSIALLALVSVEAAAQGVTYYTSRATYETQFPGQPMEDFEAMLMGPGAITGFPAPLDSTSDVPGIVAPGGILEGISFTDDTAPHENGLVALGDGAAGHATNCILANQFIDAMIITFDPPVLQAGMDLVTHTSSSITLTLTDASSTVIDTTTSNGDPTGIFWGFSSPTPVSTLTLYSPTDAAEGVDNLSFASSADGTKTGLIKVTRAEMTVDFRGRLQSEIRDELEVRGVLNMEPLAQGGVDLLDPALMAQVEAGSHAADLGALFQVRGNRYLWIAEPSPSSSAMLELDVRTGKFRYTLVGADLATATTAANGNVPEGTLEIAFVLHIGTYTVGATLETLYRSELVDHLGKAEFRPAKGPSAMPNGLFFVEEAVVQERRSASEPEHRLRMDITFTPSSGAPLDLTPLGTNGCDLSIGPFLETLGDGSAMAVFEERGRSQVYRLREPLSPTAVTWMKWGEHRWRLRIETAWMPAGTFGPPARGAAGPALEHVVSVSLSAGEEELGSAEVTFYLKGKNWRTGRFDPFAVR